MEAAQILTFGPYRLASAQGPLWQDGHVVPLQPKALGLLWLLATRVGEVVSKEELFATLWGSTVVSDGALTVCLRHVRRALGDTAGTPQYIETVHRIGYRFIAAVAAATVSSSKFQVSSQDKDHVTLRSEQLETRN